MSKIVIMMYSWSSDIIQHVICHEADIPVKNTVVDWINLFRYEAENYVERHSQEIGGNDLIGEAIMVEIDKSKFFNRKCHRAGHWVFSGIEWGSGKCFLIKVHSARLQRYKLKLGTTFHRVCV